MLSASALLFGDRQERSRADAWRATRVLDDPLWRAVAAMAVVSLLVPVLVVAILALSLLTMPFSGDLPPLRPTFESRITRVVDASGEDIASFRRFDLSLPVAFADIPPVLIDAVLAVEDRRFYDHQGVDSRGIIRALAADLRGGSYLEGASTITQQYVRMAYLGDERTLGRKLREAIVAGRLEKELSKDEILHRYLSRAYFGSGAYGVGAAAQTYFRKPVTEIGLSEAAMLAGLLSAPSFFDPRTNVADAEARRRQALDDMLAQGRITPLAHADASAQRLVRVENGIPPGERVTVVYPAEQPPAKYPWFADYVRRYLIARFGDDLVYQGGLRVETSLDPRMQAAAETAVAEALRGTQAPLDMALVSIDPSTGLVRAMVGGRDFGRSQVNLALGNCPRATAAGDGGAPAPAAKQGGPLCISGGGTGRQPGSAFKAFTLAEAFEDGIDAEKVYSGPGTYTYPRCRGEGCTVRNVESGSFGSISLRKATESSVNTVYAQVIDEVGVKDTAELAHRLGLTMINPDGKLPNGEPYGPSLTLGAAEVSPLDMAAAYGVFAARGRQFPASPVVRVLGPDGEVLEDNRSRSGKRVLGEEVADKVNDVLRGVVEAGTGKAAAIGRPEGTAGKTGTSENYSDAWFVGYTPDLSTAVWMGFADSQKPLVGIKGLPQVFGGTLPAQTWSSYMSVALAKTPPKAFVAPPKPPPPPPPPAPPVQQPAPGAVAPGEVPTLPANVGQFPESPTVPTAPTTPSTTPPYFVPYDPNRNPYNPYNPPAQFPWSGNQRLPGAPF